MTKNEILNTRNLPRTNKGIQRASVKRVAVAVAYAFLFEDISGLGRQFDNYWENGRDNEIQKEFACLYNGLPELQEACHTYPNSRFFSTEMVKANN